MTILLLYTLAFKCVTAQHRIILRLALLNDLTSAGEKLETRNPLFKSASGQKGFY